MKPHELAAQIKAAELEDAETTPKFEGIATLLDSTRDVGRALSRGKYQENEHGHVELEIKDTSDHDYPGVIVGGIAVHFVDPTGFRVKLGKVEYEKEVSYPRTGIVTAYDSANLNEGQAIMPSDERWEVIVDTIGEAIKEEKEKLRSANRS
jgi:hypothetical protein